MRRTSRARAPIRGRIRASIIRVNHAGPCTYQPVRIGIDGHGPSVSKRTERISYVGIFPFVTMRDRDSHHWAFRDAATAQVVVTADQDSVRMAKVAAVPIKRCRTVFTDHCRYITNSEIANTLAVCASQ